MREDDSTLTIWCNAQFTEPARTMLVNGIKPHQLVFPAQLASSNLALSAPDPVLAAVDVAFGQPAPEDVMSSARLRWTHLTTAGYARYDTEEFRATLRARKAILTNSSRVYAEPCAEHVLAFMLANGRQLLQAHEIQRSDRSWPTLDLRAGSRLLSGQVALLLGFGAIGRRLAELLAPFGMKIFAVRRQRTVAEDVNIITEEELEHVLPSADHVVNLLPENSGTRFFVNASRFAAMRQGAVFYNIGRGTTVDQEALLEALRSRRVSAAYLDVADPEPLPPEHPLWTTPNCFITPHTAGGHANEHESLVRHFLENLSLFLSGSPLADRIV